MKNDLTSTDEEAKAYWVENKINDIFLFHRVLDVELLCLHSNFTKYCLVCAEKCCIILETEKIDIK